MSYSLKFLKTKAFSKFLTKQLSEIYLLFTLTLAHRAIAPVQSCAKVITCKALK